MADEASVVVQKPENIENPFTSEGILSQKADYIISHSTITRKELQIVDPDNILETVNNNTQPAEEICTPAVQNTVEKSPKTPMPTPVKKGRLESIEVEVGHASIVEPMQAQEVQLKKKKRFCLSCCS